TFVPDGSATAVIARHRGPDGELLDSHTAAVEMLNVIRPTVAVSWYVMFAAHALHASTRRHEHLERGGDEELERFVQEVRRSYPFAPFLGARVRRDFDWCDVHFSRGHWSCSTSTAPCTIRRSGETRRSSDRSVSRSIRSPTSI